MIMRSKINLISLSSAAFAITLILGCSPAMNSSETIAEGVIYSAEFEATGSHTEGFTRLNDSSAVPGGNGSWNVDAYGRLTHEFLIITRPQRKNLGPQLVPTRRLLAIQFGDGGITNINESQQGISGKSL